MCHVTGFVLKNQQKEVGRNKLTINLSDGRHLLCPTMATGKTRRKERWNIIAAITLGESISE